MLDRKGFRISRSKTVVIIYDFVESDQEIDWAKTYNENGVMYETIRFKIYLRL